MWLSGEKGTRGSRGAGRKDELRGSCFFAGTPTNVKARMASSGFFSLALSFPGRVPFAVLVHDPRVALAAVWSHSWDISLQTSEDNSFRLGGSRQSSSRGNIVHAAEVKFKPRCLFFCGPTDAFPYLSLCLIRAYGCSVCRCCCLEPHESWTQKGLGVLCRVRFRDPLSIWKWAKRKKGEASHRGRNTLIRGQSRRWLHVKTLAMKRFSRVPIVKNLIYFFFFFFS